ncbi:MDIS1-interacting receptor like kinase 2-like [Prosopis cineraria]|uniref:MDIS1-interacting receptor like kinase 2-like n=1 Tax=Prosopis cineraria TaxID=364024 RepID=UPI00240EA86C|nr:MDIS1-interacting receptor like kinase 2-like [Prosopis cineraria]
MRELINQGRDRGSFSRYDSGHRLHLVAVAIGNRRLSATEALLKWKQSLPNQPILDSWVSPSPHSSISADQSPCSWHGIKCDYSGSVVELDLSHTGLQGTLENLDFSAFPNLLLFNLKFNQLTGPIPETIGLLSKLQFLDLNRNHLNGTIPLSLANLTQLYELDLSWNELTGILDPRLFPDGTDDQPKIGLIVMKYLLLQDNYLGGKIPNEIGNLKHLTILYLDANIFYGPVPHSLGNCTNLTSLTLSENKFSGIIPSSLGRLTNLTVMRFQENHFYGPLPEGFGNISFTIMLLSQNNFSGQLPSQICRGGKLVNFTAANNSFSGPIPISLRNCPSLHRLRLEHNQLTGYVDKDFGVYPILTLTSVSIRCKIGDLYRLFNLNLSNNNFSGKVPYQIGNLEFLQEFLDLSYNSLSGEIPVDLSKLNRLISLNMSHNNFSGPVLDSITTMLSLSSLNLSYNMLEGPVQDSRIFSSPYMVDLSHNKKLCGRIQGLKPYNVSIIKPQGGDDNKKNIAIAICTSLFGSLVVLMGTAGIFFIHCKRNSRALGHNSEVNRRNMFSIWNFDGRIMYKDIIEATNNFDKKYCIGEGAFGKVYKLMLPGEDRVFAIKKLTCEEDSLDIESIKAFESEIKALIETRHRNIVKLHGFCLQRSHIFYLRVHGKRKLRGYA